MIEDGDVVSRFRLSDGEIVLVTTNFSEAGTLISQPGDDKHLKLRKRGGLPATRSSRLPALPSPYIRRTTRERVLE